MTISFIGGTANGAANGGNVTLTIPGTWAVGDVSYVTVVLGTSRAPSLSVTSSSGGATFTQVVTTIVSSMVRFGVFRQAFRSTTSVQAVITGTGGSTDATSAAIMVFRSVENSGPEDVTPTSTTGNSTSPDSPSITPNSGNTGVITAVGFGLANALTAPSSFLNTQQNQASDTHPATSAMAWVTNTTTSAINPAVWTSTGAAAGWCSATIAMEPSVEVGWNKTPGMNVASSQIDEMRRVVIRSYF